MAKTNYTKVEKALQNGMQQIEIDRLIKDASITDLASSDEWVLFMKELRKDLYRFGRKDTKLYEKLGVKKKEIIQIYEHSHALTDENKQLLKKLKENLENLKPEILKNSPDLDESQIIEKERKKHQNKRFNIQEKWLPLK
jgi:hypothetical protein